MPKEPWPIWKTLLFLIAIVALLLVGPHFIWKASTSPKPLSVLLVDKTLPTRDYRKHKGITWILNNQRVEDRYLEGEPYSAERDYVGYVPKKEGDGLGRVREVSTVQGKEFDLIFLVDTYGIFQEDLNPTTRQTLIDRFLREPEEKTGPASDGRKDLVYGGLTEEDIQTVQESLAEDGTLIAQFNTLAFPTQSGPSKQMQDILGIEWSGWSGRRFEELDYAKSKDIPVWPRRDYERQHGKDTWDFAGPGWVFVHHDKRTLIILEEDEDIKKATIDFTEEEKAKYGVSDKPLKYDYWIDIAAPLEAEPIGQWKLDLTRSGKAKMQREDLPESFGAVFHRKDGERDYYYLAGAFSEIATLPQRYDGITMPFVQRLQYHTDYPSDERRFFWHVYEPLVSTLIQQETK